MGRGTDTNPAVLHAATIRPFGDVGLRTAVLAAGHADGVLVEPSARASSASHIARTLLHVRHRLLTPSGAEDLTEEEIARSVRDFAR
ncbi:hypothetical protein F9278_32525 [Streptomyces phaeolivaceus]|uniref:Uncharacterized protein n=1 Tax=Streptomyces phaeolivaceus TaxID=2653200 RepID=A0A5P8KAQ8_9ACTN|nr:hypothetical protein [Streptomyces phaeolivaceus]QFR00101.1 hypothetical protein F9278_32525 [Streptomyces phaeolivaceus]